ncbi:hypothetical protein ACHAQK_010275 [Fusarium lateritium]
MKFTNAILPLLASQAAAQVIDIQVGDTAMLDLMRQAAEASARGDHERAAELRELLSIARSPSKGEVRYKTECQVRSKFEAEIYTVRDPSSAPKEIAWAMNFLDEHWKTDDGRDLPYPGDFDRFMHPEGFRVMRADYKSLPWAVRKYHEELVKEGTQMERKFIAELDGNAFFAPGVMTWLAPLFAGSEVVPGKNACEDDIVDFSNWNKEKKDVSDDVKYSFSYGGRVQIGDHVTVELRAEKSSKEKPTEEKASEEKTTDEEAEAGEL